MASPQSTSNDFISPTTHIKHVKDQEKTPPTTGKIPPTSPILRRRTATPKYQEEPSPTDLHRKSQSARRASSNSSNFPFTPLSNLHHSTPKPKRFKPHNSNIFSPLNPLSGNVNSPYIHSLDYQSGKEYRSVVTGKPVDIEDSDEDSSNMMSQSKNSEINTPSQKAKSSTLSFNHETTSTPLSDDDDDDDAPEEINNEQGKELELESRKKAKASVKSQIDEKKNKRRAREELFKKQKEIKLTPLPNDIVTQLDEIPDDDLDENVESDNSIDSSQSLEENTNERQVGSFKVMVADNLTQKDSSKNKALHYRNRQLFNKNLRTTDAIYANTDKSKHTPWKFSRS